jgi:predicted PhzF superfamily epimerase YddE/YHI9
MAVRNLLENSIPVRRDAICVHKDEEGSTHSKSLRIASRTPLGQTTFILHKENIKAKARSH